LHLVGALFELLQILFYLTIALLRYMYSLLSLQGKSVVVTFVTENIEYVVSAVVPTCEHQIICSEFVGNSLNCEREC